MGRLDAAEATLSGLEPERIAEELEGVLEEEEGERRRAVAECLAVLRRHADSNQSLLLPILPQIVQLSLDCPLTDVREAFSLFLSELRSVRTIQPTQIKPNQPNQPSNQMKQERKRG
jgi:hypothetical protein